MFILLNRETAFDDENHDLTKTFNVGNWPLEWWISNISASCIHDFFLLKWRNGFLNAKKSSPSLNLFSSRWKMTTPVPNANELSPLGRHNHDVCSLTWIWKELLKYQIAPIFLPYLTHVLFGPFHLFFSYWQLHTLH